MFNAFVSQLPLVNAILNSLSFALLCLGFWFIKRREKDRHRRTMIAAFVISIIFLVFYLTYHFAVGHVEYTGMGFLRAIYFAILIPHVILAMLLVPLVIQTLRRAHAGDFTRHRIIARWTLPTWLYVSITGIIVYLMAFVFS